MYCHTQPICPVKNPNTTLSTWKKRTQNFFLRISSNLYTSLTYWIMINWFHCSHGSGWVIIFSYILVQVGSEHSGCVQWVVKDLHTSNFEADRCSSLHTIGDSPKPYAPCGLRGCKNGPAPFPGRMSYKATKPGLVLFYILACFLC